MLHKNVSVKFAMYYVIHIVFQNCSYSYYSYRTVVWISCYEKSNCSSDSYAILRIRHKIIKINNWIFRNCYVCK